MTKYKSLTIKTQRFCQTRADAQQILILTKLTNEVMKTKVM